MLQAAWLEAVEGDRCPRLEHLFAHLDLVPAWGEERCHCGWPREVIPYLVGEQHDTSVPRDETLAAGAGGVGIGRVEVLRAPGVDVSHRILLKPLAVVDRAVLVQRDPLALRRLVEARTMTVCES